ncbi:MAG: FAD-binding protein, partial [Eggerthellaceae bacterium]|nr:FAD-binding protein [Eggerthellaceae bacterium]
MDVSRRDLLKGSAIAAVSLAAAAGLAACKPESHSTPDPAPDPTPDATPDPSQAETYESQVSETKSCDILVVGVGASGLTAVVQAGELGAKVIGIESQAQIGAGIRPECVCAIHTKLSRAAGIPDVDKADVIKHELNYFNYKIDPGFWSDLLDNSADNIEWLQKNGVLFSGQVDRYREKGLYPTAHWYQDGKADTAYAAPLLAKAKEYDIELIPETRGLDLVMDNGKVAGVYAKTKNGSIMKILAKAVILATGGYADNKELMRAHGVAVGSVLSSWAGIRVGDSLTMGKTAGAYDRSYVGGFVTTPCIASMKDPMRFSVGAIQQCIWANQDGQRYVNEDCKDTGEGNAC